MIPNHSNMQDPSHTMFAMSTMQTCAKLLSIIQSAHIYVYSACSTCVFIYLCMYSVYSYTYMQLILPVYIYSYVSTCVCLCLYMYTLHTCTFMSTMHMHNKIPVLGWRWLLLDPPWLQLQQRTHELMNATIVALYALRTI